MSRSRSFVPIGLGILLFWTAIAPAQFIPPIMPPRPTYRLGLIDSRATEIEVIPGLPAKGLQILGVVPGSAAGRSGLHEGDVILSANSARIIVPDDLRRVMAGSGGFLRLKVFEIRTEQVLNVTVDLGSANPGIGPVPITLTGRLKVGVMAIGGETTGVTLSTPDGQSYDLDFGAGRPPGRIADGREAVVSGTLTTARGPERPTRRLVKVNDFRLISGVRPRDKGDAKRDAF
jgi:membrane-associated protease RseP (regulator of RpoE activity)